MHCNLIFLNPLLLLFHCFYSNNYITHLRISLVTTPAANLLCIYESHQIILSAWFTKLRTWSLAPPTLFLSLIGGRVGGARRAYMSTGLVLHWVLKRRKHRAGYETNARLGLMVIACFLASACMDHIAFINVGIVSLHILPYAILWVCKGASLYCKIRTSSKQ